MKTRALIWIIIALNFMVFSAWTLVRTPQAYLFMAENFLVSWEGLSQGRAWILITSVFSHNYFFHLLVNMYVLKGFAAIVIETIGCRRFIFFYLSAGIFGSLTHAAVSAFLLANPELPALGASGALAGVILLFSLLYPRERLLLLGVIPVRAGWASALIVIVDLFGLYAQRSGGGLPIGHGAHLGGALAGFLAYLLLSRSVRRIL